ncbi:MAG TPA: glutamate--tRNA ligase [Alphaproteobacteria bacterium]|nr:glutamate--tRNA ligase [Alphaproteobacteria bacterium]
MTVAVRFAPSPTGLLHVGNARTALVVWLFARKAGGSFLLRLDDTDLERSTPEFAEAIERDLAWLGLVWDRFVRQSDRTARHDAAIRRLKEDGRLYPCYETLEELALKRKSRLAQGLPPIYDRAALQLTAADRARLEAEGRRPHWRFRLEPGAIEWTDLVRGPVRFDAADLSDPVLVREDGRPLYHGSSVVDDIDLRITHVVRGEDHVANTALHVQMIRALGGEPPAFAHLPLIADAAGQGLSKRLGSLSLQALREEEGVEPMAVASLLAKLGTSDPVEPHHSLDSLVQEFDWAKFSRATPKFDVEDIFRLNARILHDMPYAAAAERLSVLGLPPVGEAFWHAVRPNLSRLADIVEWWRVATGPILPVREDPAFAERAAALLPPEPWGEETWSRWTGAVKEATGAKGKALFQPLRQALTGLDHGPELKTLLPLIGRERAVKRLMGEAA